MKKSFKYILLIVSIFVIAFAFGACNKSNESNETEISYGENIIKNGDFEKNLIF